MMRVVFSLKKRERLVPKRRFADPGRGKHGREINGEGEMSCGNLFILKVKCRTQSKVLEGGLNDHLFGGTECLRGVLSGIILWGGRVTRVLLM